MTGFSRILIGAAFLLASLQAAAADDRELAGSIYKEVQGAWRSADFAALDRMADNFAQTRAKSPSGRWRLAMYTESLNAQIKIEWPAELRYPGPNPQCNCGAPIPANYALANQRWDALGAQFDAWAARYPQSANAHTGRAAYFYMRGWFFRGAGFAKDVPDEAWPIFRKNIESARLELQSSREFAIKNPAWFKLMFSIAADQAWDGTTYPALVKDFLENGQDYPDAYFAIFNSLQPKWGGSTRAMEAFARNAAERTHAEEGDALYSRLYWAISPQFSSDLSKETLANWPKMRKGFEDMVARYPDARNFNAMAKFACKFMDQAVMKTAMIRIGDDFWPEIWRDTPYDRCRGAANVDLEMRVDPPSWMYRVATLVNGKVPKEVSAGEPAIFTVSIARNGQVEKTVVTKSSGDPSYDAAIDKVLHELGTLPPPAKGASLPQMIQLVVGSKAR